MIIHCLSCGKSTSSNLHRCPYCIAEISPMTLEMNGIEESPRIGERVKDMVLGFVHK